VDTLRNWLTPALCAALMLLQGCGGGGGGGGNGTSSATATAGTNTIVLAGSNVQPISVDAGLGGSVNLAFTSVTLCAPGSSNCQTIDNVLIDTGSSGLRIMSSALAPSLSLPQQIDAKGDPVVECAHFADGYAWGPAKLADLKISGERANSLPIQVIGDPKFSLAPSRCSATGPAKNSVSEMGANGILGLAIFRQDCGNACVLSGSPGMYYTCPSSGCQPAAIPLALQLQQPVSMFAVNNNGVIIELPSVPAGGAIKTGGSLVFGIGTQTNNRIGSAAVIGVDPGTANFTTIYNSTSYSASFIDSGSNAFFFAGASTPVCTDPSVAGFYCPPATKNLSATIQGRNGTSASVNFSVGNALTLLTSNPGFAAFGNLGAPQLGPTSFDWGLPFFYGRNVYTAIDGASTPAGPGPYVAF
jgi:hypothetical protein